MANIIWYFFQIAEWGTFAFVLFLIFALTNRFLFKKKLSKWTKRVVIILFITYLPFISWVLYDVIHEPYENDRLPIVLVSDVKMEKVNSNLYDNSTFKSGEDCAKNVDGSFQVSKFQQCKQYKTNMGTFYWNDGVGNQRIVLRKLDGSLETVIDDNGAYGPNPDPTGYPGIDLFNPKTDGTDLIFQYVGWNNPRKILKLSIVAI